MCAWPVSFALTVDPPASFFTVGAAHWLQQLHSSPLYSLDVVTDGNPAKEDKFVLGFFCTIF